MCRRVQVAQNAVLSAAHNRPVFNHNRADRHLAGRRCRTSLVQRQLPRLRYPSVNFQQKTRRLLLGHAVQRPQTPDQVSTVNADNLTARKDLGQQVECFRSFASLKVGTSTSPLAM